MLEDGDIIHECIESFCKEKGITSASLTAVGGVDVGSILVVGPEDGRSDVIKPMEHVLSDVHEVTGAGTVFKNSKGDPIVHMHLACGRKDSTITGCIRKGVKVWHVLEVILTEFIGCTACRKLEVETGFELLQP